MQTTDTVKTRQDVIMEVRDATVSFDMDRGRSVVLDGINLDIRRNEILGVVGESGSGKSMCANSLVNAVVDPGVLTGDITYYPSDGEPIDIVSLEKERLKEVRWNEIAMVIQAAQNAFNPTMTIGDHFEETIKQHDGDPDEGMERGRQLLRDVFLEPEMVLGSYPHELSGGMKQRALIALALILDPEVLVMDEPTAALDLLMQRTILSLLDDLQEKYDLTMVFVTHDLPLVSDLADRLAVMYAFEIVETGPTNQIVHEAAHPYTRALLNSVPNISSDVTEMRPIEGSSPDPVNVPEGCSYHPRCPIAEEECTVNDPDLYLVDDDHTAACHFWEEAADAIPISARPDTDDSVSEEES